MSFTKKYAHQLVLLFIVVVAATLRFYKLDFQSLWHDELFTINQADPSISVKEMFQLISFDSHPPLYVILSRVACSIFGYTPWAERFIAALSGTLCVIALYKLGKELVNEKLGLVAAVMCCVNSFTISFSQEGRAYTLVMLLSSLSYLYFIRLCKSRDVKNSLGFVVFTTLLLYTHYYGFLIVLSDVIFALILALYQKEDRKRLGAVLAGCFLAIGLCYLPWLVHLVNLISRPDVDAFWMPAPSITFSLHYYYDFFGANLFLLPFLIILPAMSCYYLLRDRPSLKNLQKNPPLFFVIYFMICFIIGNGIPYVYSVLVRPVLASRYLIFFIPFYIILLAYGFTMIKRNALLYTSLIAFLILSLLDILLVKKFYTTLYKQQTREVTSFITADQKNYPMINEWMAWPHQYYLKKYNYTGKILGYSGGISPTRTNKEWMVDSILNKSAGYNVDTFWIVRINEDLPLSKQKRAHLDTAYTLIKEAHYIGADAWLFGRKNK